MQENQKKTATEDSQSSSCSQALLGKQKEHEEAPTPTPTSTTSIGKKLPLIPLIFLIYFEVSGGPYGQEIAVGAAGPFFAILGLIVFPIMWSIPEALVTAELATTFPSNGGFVIWAHEAFGPFWGHLTGSWKFFGGVINLASYPALCIQYLDVAFPVLSSGLPHKFAIFVSTTILSLINYSGITIVGYAAVALGIVSLFPFLALSIVAIPQIDPSKWVIMGQKGRNKKWKLFFHTLFSNLNSLDNVSTLAAEVKKPYKTFPKALIIAIFFTVISCIIPMAASVGSISLDLDDWINGYYADIAEDIAGKWLRSWIEFGAVVSSLGLFQAQLSSSSYQLLGMADLGLLPSVFGVRSTRFNTPWVGISISSALALSISYMNFENVISSVVHLYSMGMLLEFSSFLWLRLKFPAVERPFKIPIGTRGVAAMCSIPSVFLLYVLFVANGTQFLVSGSLTVFGIAVYFVLKLLRKKKLLHFNNVGRKLVDEHHLG